MLRRTLSSFARPAKQTVIRLASRPVGALTRDNFTIERDSPVPAPKEGEVLLRNVYLSLDPAMRGWCSEVKSYIPPVPLGDVMRGGCVAQVVESNGNGRFSEGDYVVAMSGWCEYAVSDGKGLTPVPKGVPLTAALGPLGMTGLTAYFGLLDVGKPKEGETVLVSGGAGAVGSLVGQIAKIKGCRAVGLAGTDAKCDWLTKDLGFDAAINYRTVGDKNLRKAIREACPNGVDVYFDNVGGSTLDAALANLNLNARVPICGAISVYNATTPQPGPSNYLALLSTRSTMQGFIVFDYAKRYKEALPELAKWVTEGRLKYKEDIVSGLETAPDALNKLFDGSNEGKLIVQIADEPTPAARL